MRILVTGGAGFIGSYFVRNLENRDDVEILVYDNLHPQVHGENAAAPIFGPRVSFVKGDILDVGLLKKTVLEFRPTAVAHLVSETGTGQSYDEISRYVDVNLTGMAYLFESVRATGRELDWFLLTSSRSVYGEGAYTNSQGQTISNVSRDADDLRNGRFGVYGADGVELTAAASSCHLSPQPLSVYAMTKLGQEHLAKTVLAVAKTRLLIYRFQNVYGAGQSLINPYTGVLSIFISRLLQDKQITIFEDGQISRDFVYVEDVVSAMVAGVEKDVRPDRPMDIGSGIATRIYDVAVKLAGLAGYQHYNLPVTGEFRPGDIRHAWADISYSRSVLDWEPKISIDEGIERLYVWAKDKVS
ncbi:NAD-dependent epimerase/dehydratase family protein [Agrobacterium tumefaciens]|uniref:NAD-dependent epimerase/dehydratase family protein n=1 Tax=Agrobacterium tumefaciens TaxID=358 RepID=UPI003458652B